MERAETCGKLLQFNKIITIQVEPHDCVYCMHLLAIVFSVF